MREFLTKEQIFAADDLVTKVWDSKRWGGKVRVKTLTGIERDTFEETTILNRGADAKKNMRNFRALLVCMTLVNEDGSLMFDPELDAPRLGKKSSLALDEIFAVAQELAGLTARDVAELTENLENGQSADSTSE